MRQDYSRTAEGMAVLRALEQHQPAARLILDDPYAQAFLFNPAFRLLVRAPWLARGVSYGLQFWAPGGQEFLTMRPRLVDELAVEQVSAGIRQIVLLGAGFDTMAWRLREALRGVTIFEVDHPATQAAKRQASERLWLPPNLRFVAVDFEQEDFVEKLHAAGFDPVQRSFIVWVGVTYYLTPAAMARALQQIASLGGAGMRLVFDYMLDEVVKGTTANREALSKARRAAQLGEPWLFGLQPAEVSAYILPFGFRLVHDYAGAELRQRYAPQRPMPMTYLRIADCERL
jgi:methyltransferase (TIGR00027 family)